MHGGRWNSKGTPLVYTASSLSLAILEIMAHLDDYSALSRLYSYIPIEIPTKCISRLERNKLPHGWDAGAPTVVSMSLGDDWVRNGESAVLAVPSAIVPGEVNYLVNPTHPDFRSITIGHPVKLHLDPRLERPS